MDFSEQGPRKVLIFWHQWWKSSLCCCVCDTGAPCWEGRDTWNLHKTRRAKVICLRPLFSSCEWDTNETHTRYKWRSLGPSTPSWYLHGFPFFCKSVLLLNIGGRWQIREESLVQRAILSHRKKEPMHFVMDETQWLRALCHIDFCHVATPKIIALATWWIYCLVSVIGPQHAVEKSFLASTVNTIDWIQRGWRAASINNPPLQCFTAKVIVEHFF